MPYHDDVIKWKHLPRYWSFVQGIHRWPVNSPHKGQWRGALMLSLICAWTKNWANNGHAGDLRRHGAHYDVIVMPCNNPGTRLLGWAMGAYYEYSGKNIVMSLQRTLLPSQITGHPTVCATACSGQQKRKYQHTLCLWEGNLLVTSGLGAVPVYIYTEEPLWKGQECLPKVAKFGSFPCTILYKSCLIYPSWQATPFERPLTWVAFTEGFHCESQTAVKSSGLNAHSS